jgi:hypothetical protein
MNSKGNDKEIKIIEEKFSNLDREIDDVTYDM